MAQFIIFYNILDSTDIFDPFSSVSHLKKKTTLTDSLHCFLCALGDSPSV